MVLEIIVVQHLVNETCRTIPIILFSRFRECHMELKIREFLFNGTKLIFIEHFTKGTCTIPIRYLAISFHSMKQMEKM